MTTRTLMCIIPHPDDESLGMGGTLAKYAAEGVEISLICATRGERGWSGPPAERPTMTDLGRLREGELRCAAQTLGLTEVHFLDYLDGEVGQADPQEAIGRMVRHIRRFRPQVVITFGPDGAYGHPDHIAVSQLASAAVVCAADASFPDADNQPAHRILKLYYMVDSIELVKLVEQLMGGIHFMVDGVERSHVGWLDWMITTRIDAGEYWKTALKAIQCHKSQLQGDMSQLHLLPAEVHRQLWGNGCFYRAFSLVNNGRQVERDLFAGIP